MYTYLKRKKGNGINPILLCKKEGGQKEPDPLERKKKVNLKLVQEMPGQEENYLWECEGGTVLYPSGLPISSPQPSSILVWTARGVGRKLESRRVWDMEEVATCNDLYLLASNETSTSSHLNVPRPRMTARFRLWAHVTGPGWDEQVKGPHPRGSTATQGCQAVEVETRQSKLSCRQNHELGGHVQATWQGDHSSVTCCWVPGRLWNSALVTDSGGN